MNTDPIADLLTRIRNGQMAGRELVLVPYSSIKLAIVKILSDKGFVGAHKVTGEGVARQIEIILNHGPQPTSLKRISKPGRRIYSSSRDIPTVLSGRGLVIVSTSRGLMSGHEAKRQGLGGELICQVW